MHARRVVRRALARFALLALLAPAAGCVSTAAVPASELRASGRAREAAVEAVAPPSARRAAARAGLERPRAKLGPASAVRFRRDDGYVTPWVSASSLWTNERGVFLRRPPAEGAPGPGTFEGIEWGHVLGAEVKNFEGGQTVLAAVGVGAIGALLAAAVAADVDDDRACARAGRACGGARVAAAGRAAALAAAAADRGDGAGAADAWAPSARHFGQPGAARPDPEGARPLFDGAAKRRSSVRGLVAAEATVAPDDRGRLPAQGGALAGVRLADFVELGLGARGVAGRDGEPTQTVVVGRAGLHGEFGAARRVALPLSVDVGAGAGVSSYVRANWGVRFRIYDEITLGLFPASPTRVERAAGRGRSGWSVAAGAELSWGF
jgi:hypothetical protein